MTTNIANHDFLANDNLSDCAGNIAYWIGQVKTPGGEVFTADVVGTVPVTILGASTAQTGDLLDVKQNSGGNMIFQIATVASAATGLKITSAAAASGLAIAVLSSGNNENVTFDAKGSGTITLGSVSTGNVILGTSGHTLTLNNTTGAVTLAAGGLTLTTGNVVVTSGNVTLTSGNAVLTSGNLTLTSGNAALTSGTLTVSAGATSLTTSAVGTVPLVVNGFSTAQTADLLQVAQTSGGNNVLQVSTVNAGATGIKITSAAAGSGIAVAAISSAAAENLTIAAKGTTGTVTINPGIAVPANGSLQCGVLVSATASLGFFIGSGAPTFTAAAGSFYVRTDGSSTSTRAYVTTGGGTWIAVTTAS